MLGRAVKLAAGLPWLDALVASTDSERYAREAIRFGAEVPALRPPQLSSDTSSALDVIRHEWQVAERHWGKVFDILILLEPTSPLRREDDISGCVDLLLQTQADSVATISPIDPKHHPDKLLVLENDRLHHFTETGKAITGRQQLQSRLYNRNGLCYAFTRKCIMEHGCLFTENTRAVIVDRPVPNIDTPTDLLWAEFLLSRQDNAHG